MKKWRFLLAFLLPSIMLGALVGTYPGYVAYRYTWKNADFCISCHVHDYATVGWKNSVHGQSTTCHDCHHQPLRAYLRESWIMLTQSPKFPKDLHHTPYVKKGLCEACHLSKGADSSTITGPMTEKAVSKIPKIDNSWLHRVHMEKKTQFVLENEVSIPESERSMHPTPAPINRDQGEVRAISCADCHGGPANRGHHFSASERSCVRCHDPEMHKSPLKIFGCQNCHFQDFMIPHSKRIIKEN